METRTREVPLADCELEIRLDRTPPRFHPGETVDGAVRVHVNADTYAAPLRVDVGFEAGTGSGGGSVLPTGVEVFEGEWLEGQDLEYRFSVELPPGPFTYDGQIVSLTWQVNAWADVPGLLNPFTIADIEVTPDPASEAEPDWIGPYDPHADMRGRVATALESAGREVRPPDTVKLALPLPLKVGCLLVVLGPFVVLAVGAVALIVATPFMLFGSLHGARPLTRVAFALLVGMMLVSLLRLQFVRNWFARLSLGSVQVTVEPELARPGEEVTVRVDFTPRRTMKGATVTARLEGFERRRQRRPGGGTAVKRHDLYSTKVTLPLSGRLQASRSTRVEGRVRIPPDAAPSFEVGPEAVLWTVRVTVEVAGGADWEGTEYLAVHP